MTIGGASARWIAVVPNALSTARLAFGLAFPALPSTWRLPVVVAAGFTDFFDGLIARRYGVQSMAGGILDAVADKVFSLFVLITLGLAGQLTWWQILLVLSRDLVVAAISLYCALRGSWEAFTRMPPRPAGRWTTALLFAYLVVALSPAPDTFRSGLFWLLALGSVIAAIDYGVRFARALGTDRD